MSNTNLVNSFRENGYLVIEGAIPVDVIDTTFSLLNNKIEEYLDVVNVTDKTDYTEIATAIKTDFNALDEKVKHLLSGHFDLQTRLDKRLYGIFEGIENIQTLIKELLNTDKLYLHMPPAARWIMPSNEKAAVPAHQDISYNKHMSNFVVCWVPFVDIDDECGGVFVYDGTGKLGEMEVQKGEFWLNGIDTASYVGEHKKIKRGDVLLLNPYVLHRSFPNTSDHVRISCDFRFFGENDTSTKSYLDISSGTIVHNSSNSD